MERGENIFGEDADKPQGSLFSCIKPEGSPVHECAEVRTPGSAISLPAAPKVSAPAMQPPPPPPAPQAPVPPSPEDTAWKREVLERLSRAEASEKAMKAEVSALYTRLEQTARAGEEARKTARDFDGRFRAELERLRNDLAGSLAAGFKRLEERLASAEGLLNSLGAGPFAAKSDLDPLSRELGALRFELSSIADRADSLARALPELSRIAPKVDLLEGAYSEFLQSLRKVYEIDSRYSYLAGKLGEMESSLNSAAAARGKDQDRFSRLEVKAVELEGRADHLSSLFNYFRDMFEKFIGFNHKSDPLHK